MGHPIFKNFLMSGLSNSKVLTSIDLAFVYIASCLVFFGTGFALSATPETVVSLESLLSNVDLLTRISFSFSVLAFEFEGHN